MYKTQRFKPYFQQMTRRLELSFRNMTLRIDFFEKKEKEKTQRIVPFWSKMSHRIEPCFFVHYDSKTCYQYDSKNWTLLLNMSQRIEPFLDVSKNWTSF